MSEEPLCEFDGCTQEAIVESLVSTVDQTYSRVFCASHKQDGTNALTNEVASYGKPPRAWDTKLTGKGKREQAERERKQKEEADQRAREYARNAFYSCGRQDALSSLCGLSFPGIRYARFDHIDKATASEQYQVGWDDAMKGAEEQGKAVFLLSELVEMMKEGDEWYGTDFDKPMTLVEKVIDLIKQEKSE